MFSLSVCSGNLGFAHSAESFYLRHSQESCNHGMKHSLRSQPRFFVELGATMFPSKSTAHVNQTIHGELKRGKTMSQVIHIVQKHVPTTQC